MGEEDEDDSDEEDVFGRTDCSFDFAGWDLFTCPDTHGPFWRGSDSS